MAINTWLDTYDVRIRLSTDAATNSSEVILSVTGKFYSTGSNKITITSLSAGAFSITSYTVSGSGTTISGSKTLGTAYHDASGHYEISGSCSVMVYHGTMTYGPLNISLSASATLNPVYSLSADNIFYCYQPGTISFSLVSGAEYTLYAVYGTGSSDTREEIASGTAETAATIDVAWEPSASWYSWLCSNARNTYLSFEFLLAVSTYQTTTLASLAFTDAQIAEQSPKITDVTYKDLREAYTSILCGKISQISVTGLAVTTPSEYPVTAYTAELDGEVISGDSLPLTFTEALSGDGEFDLTITAKNKFGMASTYSTIISVAESYHKPFLTIAIYPVGKRLTAVAEWDITTLGGKNAKSLSISIIGPSGQEIESTPVSLSDYSGTTELKYTFSDLEYTTYSVKGIIADTYCTTETIGSTGTPVLSFAPTGKRAAFFRRSSLSDEEYAVNIAGQGTAAVLAEDILTGLQIRLGIDSVSGLHGILSNGYVDADGVFVNDPKWLICRDNTGDIVTATGGETAKNVVFQVTLTAASYYGIYFEGSVSVGTIVISVASTLDSGSGTEIASFSADMRFDATVTINGKMTKTAYGDSGYLSVYYIDENYNNVLFWDKEYSAGTINETITIPAGTGLTETLENLEHKEGEII